MKSLYEMYFNSEQSPYLLGFMKATQLKYVSISY